jgi:uncharacterized protein YuzE
MEVAYDPEVDVLSVLLSDAPVAESDQDTPDVILDYDAVGSMEGRNCRPSIRANCCATSFTKLASA